MTTVTTAVDALQTTLAAEHAAVHVLGVLGGRSGDASPLRSALQEAYAAHRARRDQLAAYVRDEGAEPAPAEASYGVPEGIDDVAGLLAAARDVEDACAETYAWLVAHVTGTERRWAVTALTNTAVRVLTFRGSPEIFPGAGEYADR